MVQPLFTAHGGFRTLDSFMLATLIYYGTVRFCRAHVKSFRQSEQMVQAARSGRQNIAEGSERAATSAHTEIELTDVACASLMELQLDYEDFIHFAGELPWADDEPDALELWRLRLERAEHGPNAVRDFALAVRREQAKFDRWLAGDDPVRTANAMVRLCERAAFLLRRQLAAQGDRFVAGGGFKERMTAVRLQTRGAALEAPACPKCAAPMRPRTVRQGGRAGETFWGCSKYPACDGVRKRGERGEAGSGASTGST